MVCLARRDRELAVWSEEPLVLSESGVMLHQNLFCIASHGQFEVPANHGKTKCSLLSRAASGPGHAPGPEKYV
jgi:hypothetical protein